MNNDNKISDYTLWECRIKVTHYLRMSQESALFLNLCGGVPRPLQEKAIVELFTLLTQKFGKNFDNFGKRKKPYGAIQSLKDTLINEGIRC